MINVIAPFEFNDHQFSELSEDEKYAAKKLLYTKKFQEWVHEKRIKYGYPLPLEQRIELTDNSIMQSDPKFYREMEAILGKLKCSRRKWIVFAYNFTKFDLITRPTYFPLPSAEKLQHVHRSIVARMKLLDAVEIKNIDKEILIDAMKWSGDPLYANDTVAVRGGAEHVTLSLTPEATLKDIRNIFSVVNAYQKVLLGKHKRKGIKDLDKFYEVARHYRSGAKSVASIQRRLFKRWEIDHPNATEAKADSVFDSNFSHENIENWLREARILKFL